MTTGSGVRSAPRTLITSMRSSPARFYSPSEIIMIDLDDKRLAVAKTFGATMLVNSTDGLAAER